jgi:hypothetical protein
MTAPSTDVPRVNSGLAVPDKNADAPIPLSRHRGIAGRARAGGVMTKHPTSSSKHEEAAPAEAPPPPHRAPARATYLQREAATQTASRDTALLSIGQFGTETLRCRSASCGTHSARRR